MPDSTSDNSSDRFPVLTWKVFIIEGFLFLSALGLGIINSLKITRVLEIEKIEVVEFPFIQFIVYFLLATLFIFLLTRFIKFRKQKTAVFKLLFISTVLMGGILTLSIWISDIYALVLMGLLIFWWIKRPSIFIQDLLMILAVAGAGSVLGLSFTPGVVAVLLVVFSIYDVIAVYKTKHMVEIAKGMIESRAILGLVIPPDIVSFSSNLKEITPGGKFMVLGAGDIVFPLLFSVSLIPHGIIKSLIVALFSLLGLLAGFLFFISQKHRKAIPALPSIALFSIIGYFITKLF
ncbi:MAG: presenilin family intramembrane aspartyl protease [Candidatus Nealsonbacteria bacterium]